MYFAVEILSTYLLTVKKSFKTHKLTLFFVRPQTTDNLLLLLGDIKGHIKKNVNRYFQEHQWIACFFMAKNNPDSAVFGNAGFGEIKYHSLRAAPF